MASRRVSRADLPRAENGRHPAEERVGIPLQEEGAPLHRARPFRPDRVGGSAGEAVLDTAEPGMGGDDDRAAPAIGMIGKRMEGEASAEGITGEDGLFESRRKGSGEGGGEVVEIEIDVVPEIDGMNVRASGQFPIGGRAEIPVEGEDRGSRAHFPHFQKASVSVSSGIASMRTVSGRFSGTASPAFQSRYSIPHIAAQASKPS
jgi:hypothetical protein